MDEYGRLLTVQQQLEKETDDKIPFFGLSVNETLRTCLVNGMSKRADKIKSDFKVPDKRCACSHFPFVFRENSGVSQAIRCFAGFGTLSYMHLFQRETLRASKLSHGQGVVRLDMRRLYAISLRKATRKRPPATLHGATRPGESICMSNAVNGEWQGKSVRSGATRSGWSKWPKPYLLCAPYEHTLTDNLFYALDNYEVHVQTP